MKIFLIIFFSFLSLNALAQPTSFSGAYIHFTKPHANPEKPVSSGRSYFVASTSEIQDGFRLSVDLWHGEKNSPVSLYLHVAINDGSGKIEAIPLMALSDQVKDNPKNYYSRREFDIKYSDINQALDQVLPTHLRGKSQLKVGPGSALFLSGKWHTWNHDWGGLGRGGLFYTPESQQATARSAAPRVSTRASNRTIRRPTELDIAYPITNLFAIPYNQVVRGSSVGLEVGGQIRSRLEQEGKYQIALDELTNIKERLFFLANNPNEAVKVFGPEWTVKAEMRYMKRDKNGEYLLGKDGLPVPDPMVDTYYDRDDKAGAKNDMAIRYRWTEGNATGAWNFKPGVYILSPEGAVSRLEYAIDTTDDKPQTIKAFVNSSDPLNFFRMIKQLVPGADPAEFFYPSLKISDTRYKFKFTHKSGLVVEVSLDDVTAKSLTHKKNTVVRFAQLEADIDHLSTKSQNIAKPMDAFTANPTEIDADLKRDFLDKLTGKAFLDGRPVIHSLDDLKVKSPVITKHSQDFAEAEKMIVALRDYTIGRDWIPAPQKASLAAYLLGEVSGKELSPSVRKMLEEMNRNRLEESKMFVAPNIKPSGAIMCKRLLVK